MCAPCRTNLLAALGPTFAALALVVSLAATRAQESSSSLPQHISRVWQEDQGLPQDSVEAVAQTTDGYLWVGTRRGLARFNGTDFAVFNSGNAPGLKSSYVTALCPCSDGGLWIGDDRGGLIRARNGTFERYEVGTGEGVPTAVTPSEGSDADDYQRPHGPSDTFAVSSLFEDRSGALWVGGGGGLYVFRNGKVQKVFQASPWTPSAVRAICEDGAGGLWVATAAGIYRVRGGQVIIGYNTTNGLPHNSVRSLCLARSGTLWIGTMTGFSGLSPDGTFTHFPLASGLSDRIVTALHEDRRGVLWVGTSGGLHRLVQGKLVTELNEAGGAYNSASSILEDAEGNIWVGTREGLHRLRPRRFTVYTTREGLSHNRVTAVLEDTAGAVWFATWGGGINKLENGKISAFTKKQGFRRDLILALCQDHEGLMWAGADYRGGILRFPTDGSQARPVINSLRATIRVIYQDRGMNMWVGTPAGLFQIRSGRGIRYPLGEDRARETIRVISEDHEGDIWVGTTQGLSRYRQGKFTPFSGQAELLPRTIYAIHEDTTGDLWLGTDGGLARLNGEGVRFYSRQQGLTDNEVFSVLEDNKGNLWMSSPSGVFSVSRRTLNRTDSARTNSIRCISYGKDDGMLSAQCSSFGQPAAWKGRDGRLWFPTIRGAAVIDPDANGEPNDRVPPVFIEDVFANGQRVGRTISHNGAENFPLTQSRAEFSLPPGRGDLEFRYAALSFQAPEKNHFRYQLEGVDPQWVEAGTRRAAYYNNIAPGTYRFRVAASNNDGLWNEQGAVVTIILRPYFWQSWWFRFLFAAATIAAVAAMVRYISVRKFKLRLALLEQQHAIEKERTRIARDMHDDLGARLTEILLLSDFATNSATTLEKAKTYTARVAESAREVAGNLNGIVWAVNPENDSLNSLASYFREHVALALRARQIRCRLEVPDQLPDYPLSSEIRHHLLLVVKEALNNAVKYSEATEIRFRLLVQDSALCLSVEDNGKGFREAEASALGNGLRNMRKRMEAIGGSFELKSAPGQGTRIELRLAISPPPTP